MKTEQQIQQQPEPTLAPERLTNGGNGGNEGIIESNDGLAPDAHKKFDNLHELVVNPTWRDVIIDVVHSGQIDAWNLDIVDITDRYISQVREMKVHNLHIPANVILAASILLRFKSEALDLMEEEEEIPMLEGFDEAQAAGLDVQPLQLRFRIPPKRTVTLTDLITSLNEAMDIEYRREQRVKLKVNPVLEIKLPDYDIEKEMVSIIGTVEKIADPEGWLTFSQLLGEMNKAGSRGKVLTLLPILHLCQEHKLHIVQDEVFGEILIQFGDHIQDIEPEIPEDEDDKPKKRGRKKKEKTETAEVSNEKPKKKREKQVIENAGAAHGRSRKNN